MTRDPADADSGTANVPAERLDELRSHLRMMAAEPGDDARLLATLAATLRRLAGAVFVQIERYTGNGAAVPVAQAGDAAAAGDADPDGAGRLVISLGRRTERLGNLVLHRRQRAPSVDAEDIERISDVSALAALVLRRLALEDGIRHARNEARRIVEDKYRLVSGIADEVRERLGVAIEYVQLLDTEGTLNEREERYIDRSRQSIEAVISVINDLVQLSRLDTGRVALRTESINLGVLARGMVRDFQLSVGTIGFEFDVSIPELPLIETDIDVVRQILDNLLSNAIRYTPVGGRIRVEAEVRPARRKTGPLRFICVSVSDTGPGIEDKARVFEEVFRVERHRVQPGFRLAISRRMARLLGGDLTLDTRPGQGSTFTLWLPDAPPSTPPGYSDLKQDADAAVR
ncbi:MAG: HAMP domain-containing sensor histidine kinase [Gemmatimonadota bacterium]|jgi:signal transduction histidine kinase